MFIIKIIIPFTLSLIAFLIMLFEQKLSVRYNFQDKSNTSIRKIHKKIISNIGGLACLIPILISLIFTIIFPSSSNLFFSKKYILVLLTSSILFFLLGRIDDLRNLAPSRKFICFCFIFLFFYPLEPSLIINDLKFEYLDFKYKLGDYSIYFTLLCIFIFFNVSNFIDGVNGLYGSTMLFWIIYLSIKTSSFYLIQLTLIFCLIFFLFFNLKNKVFVGNSGNAFITTLIGSLYIYSYNKIGNLFCDEIFIVFLIPGLDALRVSINRLWYGKSPFEGDRNHLHHFIFITFGQKYTWIIIIILNILPLIALKVTDSFWISLFFSTILYILTYFFFKKSKFY